MIWESGKLLTAKQTRRLSRMTGEDRYHEVQLIARRLRKQVDDAPSRDGGASPLPDVQVRLSCEYPTVAKLMHDLVYSDRVNLIATFEMFHDSHPLERSTHPSRAKRRWRQITQRMRSARANLRSRLNASVE